MTGPDYYNDIDPGACAWTRQLIDAGLIRGGVVDGRSIKDIEAKDLKGYVRASFFNGIAGWTHALDLAGWPKDRPCWTGSAPCPSFSAAGRKACKKCKGKLGFVGDEFGCLTCDYRDERHLWPTFRRLIGECRPPTVMGEQVSSKDGREWGDRVRGDLEALGYEVALFDLPASCVGAPHIRQRLFWIAKLKGYRYEPASEDAGSVEASAAGRRDGSGIRPLLEGVGGAAGRADPVATLAGEESAGHGGLGHAEGDDERRKRKPGQVDGWEGEAGGSGAGRYFGGLADAGTERQQRRASKRGDRRDTSERGEAIRDVGDGGGTAFGVANADGRQPGDGDAQRGGQHGQQPEDGGSDPGGGVTPCPPRRLGHADYARLATRLLLGFSAAAGSGMPDESGLHDGPVGVGDADGRGVRRHPGDAFGAEEEGDRERGVDGAGRLDAPGASPFGFWSDFSVIPCRDGKARRVPRIVKSSLQSLADVVPDGVDGVRDACLDRFPLTAKKIEGRVSLLKGAGNAIVAATAAKFIRAFLESEQ